MKYIILQNEILLCIKFFFFNNEPQLKTNIEAAMGPNCYRCVSNRLHPFWCSVSPVFQYIQQESYLSTQRAGIKTQDCFSPKINVLFTCTRKLKGIVIFFKVFLGMCVCVCFYDRESLGNIHNQEDYVAHACVLFLFVPISVRDVNIEGTQK